MKWRVCYLDENHIVVWTKYADATHDIWDTLSEVNAPTEYHMDIKSPSLGKFIVAMEDQSKHFMGNIFGDLISNAVYDKEMLAKQSPIPLLTDLSK